MTDDLDSRIKPDRELNDDDCFTLWAAHIKQRISDATGMPVKGMDRVAPTVHEQQEARSWLSKPVYVARPGLRRGRCQHGSLDRTLQRTRHQQLAAPVRSGEDEWFYDDFAAEMHTSIIVHEDDEPEEGTFIGLYDADGDPLYRQSERIPLGFHHREPCGEPETQEYDDE